MKDSIKREQSQAGLSFAERKNFRPKVKRNRLLLLLALLMTAATGAWAQTTINVTAGDLGKAVCTDGSIYDDVYAAQSAGKTAAAKIICLDTQNGKALALSLNDQVEAPATLNYATAQSRCEALNTTLAVTFGTWVLPSKAQWEAMIEAAGGYETLRDEFVFLFGGTKIEPKPYWSSTAGTTGHWCINFYNGNWSDDTDDSSVRACLVINLPQTYSVSLKDGVKDADKWTITPNPAEEGQTVTLQYNGRLKVKGVKATSDAPAAPASTTLNNTITAWTADKYAVPTGGLTYSDAITVSGDVTLTLTDGETLTLNKGISLASGATLTVEGNGTMNVNGTNENTTSTVAGSTGTLILTSGTLTATGGNGGSVDVVESDAHGGNGGVAINGSVIVSGGSLTARGGNGGSVDYQSANCSGGNGGDAISGSVTVSGGSLTASGGNGGSVGDYGSECSGGNGGDAINGTLTENGGSTSVNDGSKGSIGSNCDNCTAGTGGKGKAGSGGDIPNSDPYTPGGDPFSF